MALTDTAIRNAKASIKPAKLYDEKGLFLLVNPNGSKWWRFKYRFAGREKLLSLGVYPDVSLKDARKRRDEARQLNGQGVDPSVARRATKAAAADDVASTFEKVAREWFAQRVATWAPSHANTVIGRLEHDVFPWIGRQPVAEVSAPELLNVLRRIEERGATETAHRVHQVCGQVFRYAVATARAARDPAADLRGALPPVNEKHHASITDPGELGGLLRAIERYKGSHITRCALRLAPLVFVRPGELRGAQWQEFDLDLGEWRIPAERMKSGQQHLVPLSKQAVAMLRDLQPQTGNGRYLFPSIRSKDRPMSENTVNAALRRLGYPSNEMTGHGFRTTASTLLNEQGWNRDAIERQLAHAERDNVRAAYNRAEHLPERRRMMQAWADYLDRLAAGAEVARLKAA